ncbi:COMM domain-containing protein 3 [Drosophila guanche]|uniref:COMM domain-containing protein 3 n=1 Tax=Drosophila guanche TaxID=7266 RepID=A0A3B0K2S4_DROGU|nr:COMM domain-containing protein 3 [Drosophila guanche]SPP88567.1 blast:COMM domain-containing protein 3 [Drosophila guanche]
MAATTTAISPVVEADTDACNLISATVVAGLRNLGTILPPSITKLLIANSLKLTLHPDATIAPVPEIYANNAASAKQSEYAVVTLYAVATKHAWDALTLRQQLEALALHSSAVDELTRVYEDNRKDLVLRQLQVGHNFPHITDVQWRIACDVKSSTSDSSTGVAQFCINLGRFKQSSGERITIVEFVCNAEELQSLINRLKEIERHCNQTAIR